MESKTKIIKLKIGGMTCIGCQNKIERKFKNINGIISITVNYVNGIADITYDTCVISIKDISAIIEKLDYQVLPDIIEHKSNLSYVTVILITIAASYIMLQRFDILNRLVPSQLPDSGMGYGMLFVIGLLTSIHCIAMCGGINLSQCISYKKKYNNAVAEKQSGMSVFFPTFLYNLGRVISYTVIGIILGFAGLLFNGSNPDASLPVMLQGILKLIAGIFMIIMGINMLHIFPFFRIFSLRSLNIFAKITGMQDKKNKNPLIIGLLNGLMPCGPLQSMQIIALGASASAGTWAPLVGGLSMLLFSLGTVPLMLGFGSIVSALGKKFSEKVTIIGAVLVVVLGLAMLSQGGILSGFISSDILLRIILALCAAGIVYNVPFRWPGYKIISSVASLCAVVIIISIWNMSSSGSTLPDSGKVEIVDGKQVITSTLSSGSYPNITIQAGIPVKWIITAPKGSVNGCNNRMNIKEYNITNYSFKTGENVIEFLPEQTGQFQYSCWMGMIHGTITVTNQ